MRVTIRRVSFTFERLALSPDRALAAAQQALHCLGDDLRDPRADDRLGTPIDVPIREGGAAADRVVTGRIVGSVRGRLSRSGGG